MQIKASNEIWGETQTKALREVLQARFAVAFLG
jgi:hypothetical protein